jgi:hypothetical protein
MFLFSMHACKKSTYVVSTGQASIRYWTDVDRTCSSSVQSGPKVRSGSRSGLWTGFTVRIPNYEGNSLHAKIEVKTCRKYNRTQLTSRNFSSVYFVFCTFTNTSVIFDFCPLLGFICVCVVSSGFRWYRCRYTSATTVTVHH